MDTVEDVLLYALRALCYSISDVKEKKLTLPCVEQDTIEDVLYAFAFCREEVPFGVPHGAWRVMDFAVHMRRPTW